MMLKLPNLKYIQKLYEQMSAPDQRIQIDVKCVPRNCLPSDTMQYIFLDKYSRSQYLEFF